jgi:lysophospholipase L1-like esterase
MKKVVLFGDSLLKEFYKEVCETIEHLVGCDIYNCAVGGWNTEDGVKKARYISQLNPEQVIFSFGTNDAAPWKKVEIKQYKENLETIFNAFGKTEKFFLLPPPINESQLEPSDNRRTNVLQKQYSEAAKEICATHGVKLIDSWRLFEPLAKEGKEFQEDGVHFNELGGKMLIAEVILTING